MKRVLPLLAALAFGPLVLPASASAQPGASLSLCKKHKKKRHGKKKAAQPQPVKAPSSNI